MRTGTILNVKSVFVKLQSKSSDQDLSLFSHLSLDEWISGRCLDGPQGVCMMSGELAGSCLEGVLRIS